MWEQDHIILRRIQLSVCLVGNAGARQRDATFQLVVAELEDFAAYVDDPAEAALLHPRQDLLEQQQRRLDEELQLIEVRLPGLGLDGEERLRSGRVDNQYVNAAEDAVDLTDQPRDLVFSASVCLECIGVAPSLADVMAQLFRRVFAVEVVNRNVRAGGR